MPFRYGFLSHPLAILLLLAILVILVYSNTFSASFHFDDGRNIVNNPQIRNLSNFLDLSGTRYIGFLSFALNYHFGGLSVFGYHLVNLAIHILNGFLVYLLVVLLFKAVQGSDPLPAASWIPLATALLFIAHPLQTQAVTYIVQRFASLSALFYLLSVVCHLKWRLTPSQLENQNLKLKTFNTPWYALALLSTVLAMKTKENSFTLPLMLFLIEAVFFQPMTARRWATLIPFLATLLIIPFSRVDAVGEAEGGLAQETVEISRESYLLTQFRVMVTYIRLLFLPIHQNLDYDYPIYHSLLELPVFFSFLFLLSFLVLAVFLLFNSKFKTTRLSSSKSQYSQLIAFGLLWFFLTLSVESSIIPIRDVIFEHRVYLPSVGFFLAAVLTAGAIFDRWSMKRVGKGIALAVVLLSLSTATYQRNAVWKDKVSLWKDVVRKSPNKARAHYYLAGAYQHAGRMHEAVQEYAVAINLRPEYAEAYYNAGAVYKELGSLEEALRAYQKAVLLLPRSAEVHNNLGNVLLSLKRLEEAAWEYQIALRIKPDFAGAYYNLGIVYKDLGRIEEAIRAFQEALNLQPDFSPARQAIESLSR
ncbi:MAG: tetratricopeptide repeat protein [Nitrospirae bacterium]|nr:tetratricopeptide repeat protein [Nitrospirota bacterium]